MQLLENRHICLRALEPEDLEFLYKWENDTRIWTNGDTVSPYSRYTLKQYIAESHRGVYELKQLRLMIVEKASGSTVGMVDLYDVDFHHRKAGVGILVDDSTRRRGVATQALGLMKEYAFGFLKLHQLYAYIGQNNSPSLALFDRCGFQASGLLKDWIVTADGYEHVWVYQIIKEIPAGLQSPALL